jgi:hypothetical protein
MAYNDAVTRQNPSFAANGLPALDQGQGQAWLEAMMGRKYRITIEDGRQFNGELHCTDNVSLVRYERAWVAG